MINLKKTLIPLPKHIEERTSCVRLASIGVPMYNFGAESDAHSVAVAHIQDRFAALAAILPECFGDDYTITIKTNPNDTAFSNIESDEAYYIDARDDKTILCGKSDAGAFYAAVTFADMLYSDGENVYLQTAYILDYPDFKYRGQFMECRYGSEFMTKEDWFGVVDTLASMKSNQLAIGVYGCWSNQYDGRPTEYLYVPIKKYPFLKTPKNIKYYSVKEKKWVHEDNILPTMFAEDYFGEVIKYGKQKNVTVKPLFNSLGHNTLIPGLIPEIAAKDEDGNSKQYGFCTQNDKTYEVMQDIYDEIIDRYLTPNGISDIMIGMDEVADKYICHCDKCKDRLHSELIVEYIIRLCKHLKHKGMKRIYVYHDMLYSKYDILKEDLKDKFVKEGIYDEVVIDWWTYEDPTKLFWNKAAGVNNLFHSVIKPFTGYYNWIIPTDHNPNIRACVSMAKDLGFEGVESYGSYDECYDKNYLTLADVSWNSEQADKTDDFNSRYAQRVCPSNPNGALSALEAMSDIMIDETHEEFLNRVCHWFEYYYYSYDRPGLPYPQNFPSTAFERIKSDEKEYIAYFELLKQKSNYALDFFETNGEVANLNSTWLLSAKHYYTISDEYLTLYRLNKLYNDKMLGELDVMSQIDRLITQRESVMELAENVKTKHNIHTYLRNMTLLRQLLIDLKNAFYKALQSGKRLEWNITDWTNITSKTFDFLR